MVQYQCISSLDHAATPADGGAVISAVVLLTSESNPKCSSRIDESRSRLQTGRRSDVKCKLNAGVHDDLLRSHEPTHAGMRTSCR